ncbi:MAG: hypothetical protein K6F21_07760 [Bacteroidales bacterium]|nr:hypothetical protein [Bacteroidales bacterium]
MNKTVKYLLLALLLMLLCFVTVMVSSKAHERRHLTTCKKVEISFRDTLNFVSEDDIRNYLKKDCPVFIGQRIDSIRLHEIEKVLDSRSAILSSQAWTSDSVLYISITQREPVARMETSDHAFYVDDRGFIFPIQGDCGREFPLVQGHLPLYEPVGYKGQPSSEKGREWMDGMLRMLEWMKRGKWDGRFKKIRVEANGDLVLLPVEGKESFIFGKAEELADKFGKIDQYYKRIRPVMEEGYYSTVNVKYKGQIICRK